jgi:hypothetical protein
MKVTRAGESNFPFLKYERTRRLLILYKARPYKLHITQRSSSATTPEREPLEGYEAHLERNLEPGALRHRRLLSWTHAWTSTKSDSLTSGPPPPRKKAGFTWPPRTTCTASKRHNATAMPAPQRSLPRTWSTRTSRWAWKTKPSITAQLLELIASITLEPNLNHTSHPNRPQGLFGCLYVSTVPKQRFGSTPPESFSIKDLAIASIHQRPIRAQTYEARVHNCTRSGNESFQPARFPFLALQIGSH